MSALIAVTYPGIAEAEAAAERLRAGQVDHRIDILDLVIAERDEQGKVKLHQSEHPSAEGAIGGGFLGLLVGLIFAAPIFGAVGGAAIGATSGALTDNGISDAYMKSLAEQVAGGRATVFVLLREEPNEKGLELFKHDQGRLLHTSLSHTDDERLRRIMAEVDESR